VQYKNNITDLTWTPVAGGTITGDGTTKSVSDLSSGSGRFYRALTTQ